MSFPRTILTFGVANFPKDLSADSSDDYWTESFAEVSYVDWWRGFWMVMAIAPLGLIALFIANTLHHSDLALALFPLFMTVPASGIINAALAFFTLLGGTAEKPRAKRKVLVVLKSAHYSVWLFRLGVFAWLTALTATPI